MTASHRMPAQLGERAGVASLALAVVTLVIFSLTFRGLAGLTLALSAAAFLLGVWGALTASRPAVRIAAVVGLVVGLLALLVSIAALVADLNVSGGYDVYQRQR
jgi:succinate-acetate transporter protein